MAFTTSRRGDGHRRGDAPQARPNAAAPVSPARAAAFSVLHRVATSAAHSDDLLHAPAVNALSPEDRNLTTALVLGVLRWQLQLDTVFRPMLQRPDAELTPAALLALRMGAFQILHMDRIPAHAAVNESVELARANGAPHAAGMVNAVLRRILRERSTVPVTRQSLVAKSPAETAHPAWLLQRWRKHLGGAAARAVCEYDQTPPPEHTLFVPDPTLPAIDDGSRLVAEMAAVAVASPGRILDCCAAPGGKTMLLAARHADAEIVAADVSAPRLTAMKARLQKANLSGNVKPVLADMTRTPEAPEFASGFDLVLCDAPCSGTGTLARNPEIRYRLRESDLPRQAERQRDILATALSLLAPGGRLVYSTCSLEPEENEAVVSAVLEAQPALRLVNARTVLDGIGTLTPEGAALLCANAFPGDFLRTVPGSGPGLVPCDGFFAALIEKT